ncbi:MULTISPECIES: dihydrolipoamide acetyltransferase family protein [unclassified Mycolicibacterium]|uniref:dihydrolipoamide acetyltransferase family protein n=1 Tax=unclassified Mycolicibacterium TaxID=2636767 RepID=UPI0012DF897A|nr:MULTISPECIES: dihydrolipoamide acetyltransferase family protein [unclassified Mycolicibacterium]MUL84753.1 2-oxo acid dehydrogenase subunit E2 [Mycolicibacterium sp. CBMA 329]MUL88528.1 2-oxo acid dehydrogenase subunit E2 [Mycolicibacterium sp. CBMA 331]MUM00133.1 2-oxo acid dehydrogenase subunit E2 [Mycolicibacterium sp. CBMA 334]MUM27798.1 2-oxo acid dehydrogenase subunit E2 [Mycolicibacterium sp. CBMA 295]MUM40175.1 2-oxo acid dehydrogenase subunit E2 [Mycolicibacterium sp. CBMA 247]
MSGQHFAMPDVGEGIAEAEVIEWLVKVGDTVAEDQPVIVVETDKSQVELPSPFTGVISDLHVAVGDTVKVGTVLITVIANGAQPAVTADSTALGPSHTAPDAVQPTPAASPTGPDRLRRRPLASPSTRRLAVSLGVDLTLVTGTGPHGRIQADDVRDTAAQPQPGTPAARPDEPSPTKPAWAQTTAADARDAVISVRGLRRQIAKSMTQSLQIPHVTEFREIDATALLHARTVLKIRFEQDGIRLSVLPLLVKATARALARHRSFNATYDADREELTQYGSVDIGIATATDDGLIVPVIRDVDRLSLRAIATEIDRVAELARTRKAKPEELGGAGFTITNFGSFGTWMGTPIIRHPEVAIAGFGRIREQVIPVDGQPAVRPVLPIVVATDHRINDGADLGAFVTDVADALQQPLLLLD